MLIQVSHTVASATPEKAETYRITVRAASYVDRSHYQGLCREGMEQYAARFGFETDEDTDDPEARGMRNLVFFRAQMLCVIDRERTADGTVYLCDYKSGVPDAQFERRTLPTNWTTLDGMADEMPTAFLDAWLEATWTLNAGVLGTVPDRFLPLSVTTSSVLDG